MYFVTIDFDNPNLVDCAIAEVQPALVSPLLDVLGKLALPVVTAQKDMLVKKVGRSTQMTRGRVKDVNATTKPEARQNGAFLAGVTPLSKFAAEFSSHGPLQRHDKSSSVPFRR